ncbi:MAG: Hsp20/alpha crystallin family protein [Bdellovibrionales bacterium]|nr:Hsp20/alpha crystallin family protein [Bdellovibrionales bacterium]
MKFRDLVPWKTGSQKVPVVNASLPVSALQQEMNRVFEDFFTGFSDFPMGRMFQGENSFTPQVDVKEDDRQIVVKAEFPGMEEKDIHLTLKDDHLVLEGEKKLEEERTEGGARYYESSYGTFRRIVPFHAEIDSDKVDATLKKGVLTIVLPKSAAESRATKKISIRPE